MKIKRMIEMENMQNPDKTPKAIVGDVDLEMETQSMSAS